MQKNLTTTNAIVRVFLGFTFVIVFFLKVLGDDFLEVSVGVIGFILLATAFLEFCPLYYFLGIKKRQKSRKKFY